MMEPEYSILAIRLIGLWLVISCLILLYGRQVEKAGKRNVVFFFLRLLSVWLIISITLVRYGHLGNESLLPVLEVLINAIQDDATYSLQIIKEHPNIIHSVATLKRNIFPMKSGNALPQYIDILDFTLPTAILTALLCAWPVKNLRSRILLLAMALPLAVTYLLMSVPFYIAGVFDEIFREMAKTEAEIRPIPLFYRWLQFLEGGGRWLLVLIMALTAKHSVEKHR